MFSMHYGLILMFPVTTIGECYVLVQSQVKPSLCVFCILLMLVMYIKLHLGSSSLPPVDLLTNILLHKYFKLMTVVKYLQS